MHQPGFFSSKRHIFHLLSDRSGHSFTPSQVSGLITHPPPPAPQAPVDKCPAETGVESLTAPLANTEPAR